MRLADSTSKPFLARTSGRVLRIILLLITIPLAGCELNGGSYPTESQLRVLVVHGMLAADGNRQQILLEYSRTIEEGFFRGLTPASGAQVEVVGSTTHDFIENASQPGLYEASFLPAAGTTYILHVRGPAHEELLAQTRIPHAPVLRTPAADTTVRLGATLLLGWSNVPDAHAYLILDRPAGQETPAGALAHPAFLSDTLATVQPGKFGGTSFLYRVAAVDSNYVRYIQAGGDAAPAPADRVVSGGYGLFGSYALSNARAVSVQ